MEQYDVRPSIDDTYQAEAMNSDAFDELYSQNANQLINIVICIQTLGILMIFACTVIVLVCAAKSSGGKNFFVKDIKHKSTRIKQTMLISISVNGLIFVLYAIAMDGAAVHFRNNGRLPDLKAVHHGDKIGQPFDVLYNLPVVTLVFDLFALLMYITTVMVCTLMYYRYKRDNDHQTYSLCVVTPSLLGPLLCIISHSHYIAIAYIDDAYYAGSILVYYIVVFYVCCAAIHATTRSCFKSWVLNESNIWKWISFNGEQGVKPGGCAFKQLLCPILVIILLLCILCTVAMVICYFVIIPLNGSISGAPHQLFGFYHTVIIFLGVYVTYKTVLHNKIGGFENALMNRKDTLSKSKWEELPAEEKKRKFYDLVIDVVEHKSRKYGNETKHSPLNPSTGEFIDSESQKVETITSKGDTQMYSRDGSEISPQAKPEKDESVPITAETRV